MLLKIILSNQVELNPGPINSSNNDTKYRCYVCNESVLWTEKGVACDRCDQWFHTKCINMSTQTYIGLDTSANWFCNKCESPNSLNSIYQSIHIDSLSSKNSLLNSTNFSENGNSSLNNLGSPIASSSPKKGGKYKIKININSLRILTGNFQSARSKSHETALLIESSNPDIIIGTETLLKPGIYDSEVITPSYTLYRNDRANGYAGVLLAVKSHITSSEYSKIKNIEFIAAKIQLSKQKPLIIGSYYRPPNKTDDIYINKTVEEFSSLCNNNKSVTFGLEATSIRVITKLPNSEQSYKGKVKTHNYINRQNQSTTGKR